MIIYAYINIGVSARPRSCGVDAENHRACAVRAGRYQRGLAGGRAVARIVRAQTCLYRLPCQRAEAFGATSVCEETLARLEATASARLGIVEIQILKVDETLAPEHCYSGPSSPVAGSGKCLHGVEAYGAYGQGGHSAEVSAIHICKYNAFPSHLAYIRPKIYQTRCPGPRLRGDGLRAERAGKL